MNAGAARKNLAFVIETLLDVSLGVFCGLGSHVDGEALFDTVSNGKRLEFGLGFLDLLFSRAHLLRIGDCEIDGVRDRVMVVRRTVEAPA